MYKTNRMKKLLKLLSSSTLAGICIGIAGLQYLRLCSMGIGWLGAILFSLGLVIVCSYGFSLFTGVSGYCTSKKEWRDLPGILLGNIFGCWLVSLGAKYSLPEISDLAISVYDSRILKTPLQALILGTGCGFLMTVAVKGLKWWVVDKDRTWIPLFLAVPGFIFCGFLHSIADSFYILCLPYTYLDLEILKIWGSVVIGNLIGCNLVRILTLDYWKI